MNRSTCQAWLLTAAVACTALLAQEWLAPAAARASCGDYVTIVPQDGEHETKPEQPAPPTPCGCPERPQEPCQGPWCSGSHAPLPTPVSTVELVRDGWACWWAAFLLIDLPSAPLGVETSLPQDVSHDDPIFHPPRPLGSHVG